MCAWIIGKLGDPAGIAGQRVTFRPHRRPLFFLAETGEDITTADAVRFDRNAQAWI